jgi:hypothetical protein
MNAGELRYRLLGVPDDMDAAEACQRVGLVVDELERGERQWHAPKLKTAPKQKATKKKAVTG